MSAELHDHSDPTTTKHRAARRRRWGAFATLVALVGSTVAAASPAPIAEADGAAAAAAPCTIYWDGGGGDASWLNAANWTDDRLPTWADDACVYAANAPTSGITLNGASNQIVNSLRTEVAVRVNMDPAAGLRLVGPSSMADTYIDSGYLQSDSTLVTGSVFQTGGAMGGAGGITVYGAYHWSGGQMWGSGWTTIQYSASGTFGLYLQGGDDLKIDQRLVETGYGFRWEDDTMLSLANAGSLRTYGESEIEAPGAFIDGAGTLDNRGGISALQGADVVVNVPYAAVDGSWWNVGTLASLTLGGTSIIDGDLHLLAGSTTTITADVTFTAASEIVGPGAVETSDEMASLKSAGSVDVGQLKATDGGMQFSGTTTADDVEIDADSSAIIVTRGHLLTAGDFTQQAGAAFGAFHVTGDADVAGGKLAGEGAANTAPFTVDGTTTFAGKVLVEAVGLTTGDLTFAVGASSATPVFVLAGDGAHVEVLDTATVPVDTTMTVGTASGGSTDASFHAHVLDVTADEVIMDVPTVDGVDDVVKIGDGTQLILGQFEHRGNATVEGELVLADATELYGDIDVVGDNTVTVDEGATVRLHDGAAIGGREGIVANSGTIVGTGSILGRLSNYGDLVPEPSIDVIGDFWQAEDGGRLLLESNGDDITTVDVSGNAELAGDALLYPTDGGEAPHGEHAFFTAAGTMSGQFHVGGELDGCGTVRYDAHAVVLVAQPCVVVAAGHAQEDAGHIDFVVSLSVPPTSPVIVHYGVVPGTADITDYVDEPAGTLTIPAGASTGTISIGLVDDEDEEQDENFTLSFSVEGGTAENAEATGTILDDDTKLDMAYQGIPMLPGIHYIQGLGTEYVVGVSSPDADTDIGWAYRITDDVFAQTQGNFQPSGMNESDQAVGWCSAGACMRDHGVDTLLSKPSGASVTPTAISDDGEIVGYVFRQETHNGTTTSSWAPVRWASATAPYEEFAGLPGSTSNMAVDVNLDGTIIGTGVIGQRTHGWVRTPDGTVTDIGTILDLPQISLAGIAADGTVAGAARPDDPYSYEYHGFTWTKEGGMVDLGPKSYVLDINSQGDMVGLVDLFATLWRDGRSIDLNKALDFGPDSESGLTLINGEKINDQGTIVVKGSYQGSWTTGVLVPAGAGCKVCLDAHVYEAEFPRPDYLVDAGDQIVEGNPAELFAEVTNHDKVSRTVTVTFVGADGQPMGEPSTLTIAPDAKQNVSANWDTEGLAWKDGVDAGPVDLKIEMRDVGGRVLASVPFRLRVIPRPVVNVHGMNSDESTWAAYPAFVSNAHVGWQAFAVDTMDTSSLLPNTVAENAALLDTYITKIQTEQNAWQVDLVAHSMGGLISRYYIQNLMQDHDGHRPARQLVMLGTPNAGSPCADLFTVPMTVELRTDVMAVFNALFSDHRGVPFSIAAGDSLPTTCGAIGPGDMVVPLDSALYGVEDSQVFPILHTDMTFSAQLFGEFVLPRLDGQHQVAATARTAAGFAAPTLAGDETVAPASTTPPQLLQRDDATLAADATVNIPVQVPAGLSSFGVTALGGPSLEIALVKSGVVIATTGTNAAYGNGFRTITATSPASGSWTIRLVNHGTTAIDTPVAVWAQGAATQVIAEATQVGIKGNVKVTAHLAGAPLAHPITRMMMTAHDRSGDDSLSGPMYDDGTNGDAVAGDGIFTGTFAGLVPGPVVIDVSTDNPYFYRITSVGFVLKIASDGPGNDAPIALPASVTVPTGSTTRIDLEAADPEGEPIGYQIVTQPAHGKIGGSGPFFDYLPTKGYMGPDSFTYRVYDGELWSQPATVTITVDRAETWLSYREPTPASVTTNSTMHVVLGVQGASLEAVDGGTVTLTFGSHTVTAPVKGGRVDADVLADLPGGRSDLVMTFSGNTNYAPATITQSINVVEGVAPVPSLQSVTGEAGYPVRFEGLAGDNDGDAIRYQFDFTDDGVFDAEFGPSTKMVLADHVFDAAFTGQARLRVTDAAGHVVEVVAPVTIAPHRELGALQRILVGGEPVRLIDISEDGRYVMYQATDHEGEQQLPAPYGVLDRQTGMHELVSVRPDGVVDGMPRTGALSPDGRTVAFSSDEYVDGFLAPQTYVRDLATGDTVLASLGSEGQRADRHAEVIAVTNGGTRVLFTSFATNMVSFDNLVCGTLGQTREPCQQLYLRDLTAGTTTLISQPVGTLPADIESYPGMSADGRYVAYASRQALWFVDTQTGARTKLPIGIGGADGNRYGTAEWINISADGRYVTFTSEASNLSPLDTDVAPDIFRFDRQTGTTTLLDVTPSGTNGAGSAFASADSNAARTVFWSSSPDLVAGDTNQVSDIFVREASGEIRRISVEARDGIQGDHESMPVPLITGNGRFVAFESEARNLVPGDIEGYRDTFLLDLGNTSGGGTPPPVNHAPTASPSSVSTDEDSPVPVTLVGTDADDDELTYAIVDAPAHGTLTGSGADRTYTPAANWSGTDTFTFTVSDGVATSAAATITVTVRPTNDAPTASVSGVSTDEDTAVAVTLTGSDIDGDVLTYAIVSGPAHGTLTGSGADRTYTPAANWSGTDSVTFTVSDGTATSPAAPVTITVRPVNDAPTATSIETATSQDVAVDVTLGGTDIEGDALSWSILSGPAHGSLTGPGAARTYTPAANWSGSDSFTYAVSDGVATSAAATVTITVHHVNHAPTAVLTAPATLTEGSTGNLTIAATDVDGDTLTYTWATDGGTVLPNGDGTAASLAAGDGPATRHVTVVVSDGSESVTVAKDVAVTNVAPVVTITTPATNPSVSAGTALGVTATVSDAGGDAVTCRIAWGDTTAATSGCSGSHAWSTAGTYTVTVTATDDDGASSTATRTVTVTSAAWPFTGFFSPLVNPPTVNWFDPGSTIPVRFSLGGYRGMAIFAAGYPASYSHPCSGTGATGAVEPTTSTAIPLTYDAKTKRYTYTWLTSKAWAGTCRTLVVKLADGSVHTAEIRFKGTCVPPKRW